MDKVIEILIAILAIGVLLICLLIFASIIIGIEHLSQFLLKKINLKRNK